MILFFVFLFFRKDKRYFFYTLTGFILTMLPFIAFELKNNFFLINAFIGSLGGFSTFSERTLNPFLSLDTFLYVFGLGPAVLYIPELIGLAFNIRIIVDTVIGIIFVYFLVKRQKFLNFELIGVILSGLFVCWYFGKQDFILMRYVLSIYPLFIISFVAFVSSFSTSLILVLIIPMLMLSLKPLLIYLIPI